MSEHVLRFETDSEKGWYGRCSCEKWSTLKYLDSRSKVDDAHMAHIRQVMQARSGLQWGKRVSLKSERDYYREQAARTDISPDERDLWAMLERELSHRLNDTAPVDDPALFD